MVLFDPFFGTFERPPEAKIRLMESGRVLLAMDGFSDELFDDYDLVQEKLSLIVNSGQFPMGVALDDEIMTRRLIHADRVGRCGAIAGNIVVNL